MKRTFHVASIVLSLALMTPGVSAQLASSDPPFIAVSAAWQDAWNRHDMDALAEVVAADVDFITVGGRWLKGREAFRKHHAELHAKGHTEAVVETRATHVQRLSADIVLLHVEHTIRGDRNPDGTARAPSRDTLMTWVLMQSGGRWRIRASPQRSCHDSSGPIEMTADCGIRKGDKVAGVHCVT